MNGLQGKSRQKPAKKAARLLITCALAALSTVILVNAAVEAKKRALAAFMPSIPVSALFHAPVHAGATWALSPGGRDAIAPVRTAMIKVRAPKPLPSPVLQAAVVDAALIETAALTPQVEVVEQGTNVFYSFHEPLVIEFSVFPETMMASRGERVTNHPVKNRHIRRAEVSAVQKAVPQVRATGPVAASVPANTPASQVLESAAKPQLASAETRDGPAHDYSALVVSFGLTHIPKLDEVVAEPQSAPTHWALKAPEEDALPAEARAEAPSAEQARVAATAVAPDALAATESAPQYEVSIQQMDTQDVQSTQSDSDQRTDYSAAPANAAMMAPPIPVYQPVFDVAAAQATPLPPLVAVNISEEREEKKEERAPAQVASMPSPLTPIVIAGAMGPQVVRPPVAPSAAPPVAASINQQSASNDSERHGAGDTDLSTSVSSLSNDDERKSSHDPMPAPTPAPQGFRGRVLEAFSEGGQPVLHARIQIVGSAETTRSNERGEFSFESVNVDGVLPVIISKDGYRWRRVDLLAGRDYNVELVADNAVRIANLASGESSNPREGFLFGQIVDPAGAPLAGYRVELQGANDGVRLGAGPNYMDKNGAPSRQTSVSSERGQFLFSSVPEGTYLLVMNDAYGRERAPHIVHVGSGEGIVRKYSAGTQRHVSGRLINGQTTGSPVSGAQVQFLGNGHKVLTDRDGRFNFGDLFVDCDELNYLQMEHGSFFRNRFEYSCAEAGTSYYPMPMSRIEGLASEASVQLASKSSFIVGHVGYNFSTKAQLIGPEEMEPTEAPRGYDFYFGTDGVIAPSRSGTSRGGNFIITGAPAEFSYLQVFDGKNRTRMIRPILGAPDTVNVTIH